MEVITFSATSIFEHYVAWTRTFCIYAQSLPQDLIRSTAFAGAILLQQLSCRADITQAADPIWLWPCELTTFHAVSIDIVHFIIIAAVSAAESATSLRPLVTGARVTSTISLQDFSLAALLAYAALLVLRWQLFSWTVLTLAIVLEVLSHPADRFHTVPLLYGPAHSLSRLVEVQEDFVQFCVILCVAYLGVECYSHLFQTA